MPDDIANEDYRLRDRQAETIAVDGVQIARVHTNAPLTSASRLAEAGDEADTRPELVSIQSDTRQEDERRRTGVRLARRIAALRPSQDDQDNKPVIMVLGQKIAGGATLTDPRSLLNYTVVNEFDQFILSNVQEQDAEKTFVVETFGQPHIFSSGRFLRKFVFAGSARTAPVNYQSSRPRYALPQNVLLRKFYDEYLRATEQIRSRRITRIIVDGAVYDGYVSTLNFSRTAEVEHFANFTFTMLGVRRSHAYLEQMADQFLRERFFVRDTERSTFVDTIASAELTDAFGELELSLSQSLDGSGQTDRLEIVEPVRMTRTNTEDTTRVALHAVGHPQILRVTTDANKAVELLYRTATASSSGASRSATAARRVGGSAVTITGEGSPGRELELSVVSYRELFEYLARVGEVQTAEDGQIARGQVSFTIFSATADPVVLTYSLELEGREQWQLTTVAAEFTNLSAPKRVTAKPQGTFYPVGSFAGFSEGGNPGLIDALQDVPFRLVFALRDGAGRPFDTDLYAAGAVKFNITKVDITPAISDDLRPVRAPEDVASLEGSSSVALTVTPDLTNKQFLATGRVNLRAVSGNAAVDLRDKDQWPFRYADRIRVRLTVRIEVPGLTAPQGADTIDLQFGVGGPAPSGTRSLDSIYLVTFRDGLTDTDFGRRLGLFEIESALEETDGPVEQLDPSILGEILSKGKVSLTFRTAGKVTLPLMDGSARSKLTIPGILFNSEIPLEFRIRSVNVFRSPRYVTTVEVFVGSTKTADLEAAADNYTEIATALRDWTQVAYLFPGTPITPPTPATR